MTQIVVLPRPHKVRRPRRQLFFWIPRTCVLQCLSFWAIKNIVISHVLGVMAPMGKLVTCLGRLGRQNRIKGSRRVCFGGHCLLFFRKKRYPEREGSQVAFSLLTSKPKTDQLYDRNLDVQDLPESSVYTVLPVNRTIPTTAVWA